MEDVIYALKQEIVDYINNVEAKLMASTLNAHDEDDGPESHTMAILYRHGQSELPTIEYRSVVLELGWKDDGIFVLLHKCILGPKPTTHRSKYWMGASGPNPCVPGYQLELIKPEVKLQMNIIGDSISFDFFAYQDNPQVVPEWVLKNSTDWLFKRLRFAEVSSGKIRT